MPELNALYQVFHRLSPLDQAERDALSEIVTARAFQANEWLLQAGARAEWCFFLTRGLVRELYLDDAGVEHSRRFLCEHQVTGSLLDLLSGEPSITWIQALEDTQTLAFRYRDLEGLCQRFASFSNVARRSAEALYIFKARREYELLALPAAKRYASWLEENPDLDPRVSRRHLASYLGITPEHLSRLRQAARGQRARPAKGAR